jgi:predicted DsbA family dithiol-disulfide isomerase
VDPIKVLHFTDPGCPWAYSAWPALTALGWRYGDGLDWTHVLIGLTEEREQYLRRGYTPAMTARTRLRFAEYGMPFGHVVKPGVAATSRACRAVVAARQQDPAFELPALRALQWLQFTTASLLDDDAALEGALAVVSGLDAAAAVAAIDSDAVRDEYEADRARARTAEGTPAEAQGKTAQTDGPVRYTAPSLVLEDGDRRLIAGGWQTLEAYDVCVANLRPDLPRRAAPASPLELLLETPYALTTAEVAETMRQGNDTRDVEAAREALIGLAAEGLVVAEGLGDDALWAAAQPATGSASRRSASAMAAASGVEPAASASS